MDWTEAEAALEEAAASVFDKTAIRILPRKEGASVNEPRIADESRAEFDAFGTIEPGAPALPAAGRWSGDPSVKAMPVIFEAVLTAHVRSWPYVPGRGDRILVGSKCYDIQNVDRDGTMRAVFHLNRSR